MLQTLIVKDFALIDDLNIDFGSGLNVLTGETGTGKSLLLDALQTALGRRASADYVRSGAKQAYLEAIFDVEDQQGLCAELGEFNIETEELLLIFSRQLQHNGRSIYRLNGQVVPLAIYSRFAARLVDFHGQGEQQSLLQETRHGELLDLSSSTNLQAEMHKLRIIFEDWKSSNQKILQYREQLQERAQRLDQLNYQIEEIKSAELVPGEEEELREEKKLLDNADFIAQQADTIYEALYGTDEGTEVAVSKIGQALEALRDLAKYKKAVCELADTLESALEQVQEVARDVAAMREQVAADPLRLDDLELRLAMIEALKRKYGASIQEILAYQTAAEKEKKILEDGEQSLAELEQDVRTLQSQWQKQALKITQLRQRAAQKLEKLVAQELSDLELGQVQFEVCFNKVAGPNPYGLEKAVFLFSANPGEPAKPLSRVASGGELSRIMLALKNLLAANDQTVTLIFDEVDAGIGGRALQAVAEKLYNIGRERQVVCVTHAAQIASYADRHLQITKEINGSKTCSQVAALDEQQKLEELARMLAGTREITAAAREHARELRRNAANIAVANQN